MTQSANPTRPFPREQQLFSADERVYFDKETETHHLEDEDGQDYEWSQSLHDWLPTVDDRLKPGFEPDAEPDDAKIELQQLLGEISAFGTEENTKKRKADNQEARAETVKKHKAAQDNRDNRNKAIYVTGLPPDTDEIEIHNVFSRHGLIDESWDTDKPRIKMYHDDKGDFKGEALIVYFKPESVPQSIMMLDETDFRAGQMVKGKMRVFEADPSRKTHDVKSDSDQTKRKPLSGKDRKKMIAKQEAMNKRLEWNSDDESEDLYPARPVQNRRDRLMVMKGIFTLEELAEDPGAYFEIKEDLREQCETFGKVTAIVLYDLEKDGIVTVRFAEVDACEACVRKMNGRMFDGRALEAWQSDGNERFKKTDNTITDPEAEEKRLAEYTKRITEEGATNSASPGEGG